MSPHVVITLEDHDDANTPTVSFDSPDGISSRDDGSTTPPRNGRVLYCRKCEGHGEKVVLKNHAPSCPYILCECPSCNRLNQKRLKSFNKRNADKLQLAAALNEQRRRQRELEEGGVDRKISSCSSTSSGMDSEPSSSRTGLEGRSMSLGAMTVMSYDIWKAKCAAEKKRLEAEGKSPVSMEVEKDNSPIPRKRAHTFIAQTERSREIPKVAPKNVNEKKGRYILLPTIPAMKIFVDDEEDETKMEPQPEFKIPSPSSPQMEPMIVSPTPVKPAATMSVQAVSTPTPIPMYHQTPLTSLPITTAAQMTMPSPPPNTLAFPTPITSAPMLTPEQLYSFIQPSVLLQNTILQQQNAALQQLLGILPVTTAAAPAPSTSADLFSLLRCQPLNPLATTMAVTNNDDVLRQLIAGRQAIYSHTI